MDYELRAWRGIQQFKGRPLSRVMGNASGQAATDAAELGKCAPKYLGKYPRTQLAVSYGQEVVAKGTRSRAALRSGCSVPSGPSGAPWFGTRFGRASAALLPRAVAVRAAVPVAAGVIGKRG